MMTEVEREERMGGLAEVEGMFGRASFRQGCDG